MVTPETLTTSPRGIWNVDSVTIEVVTAVRGGGGVDRRGGSTSGQRHWTHSGHRRGESKTLSMSPPCALRAPPYGTGDGLIGKRQVHHAHTIPVATCAVDLAGERDRGRIG